MKRIIQSTTTFVLATIAALSLNSCMDFDMKTVVGSGNVKTETRKIDGAFTKVQSERGLDVVIEQADQVSVVVEADDNVINGIKTRLEGDKLIITSDYNSYSNVASKKVTVKMPKISSLEAESGSSLTSSGNLRSEDLDLSTSSGADMKVVVEADNLSAGSSSGSHLEVTGKALDFRTDSSSGSEIKAGDLLANDVSADASSGSNILVHPLVKLDGKASSGGSVRYNNDPKSFTKDESSGGSVSKQ
ncbi:DUF2807 domain-containing protein [Flavobacterium sp. MAH-1]|uniref:DUF2807 domain-containing protein n=1 Tax=Flavobacterium agri TaxID=2743471 RepID=A0A7Y9C643_9FLAO|nr:head GIN domain-containing protein [Flavobacterium agri]NUY81050.1 DUF2807 domain-containing protein [Flavobacterium agri]NYA71074.1 DUF2807 domain-containing protein [Flavobacterium agri]